MEELMLSAAPELSRGHPLGTEICHRRKGGKSELKGETLTAR